MTTDASGEPGRVGQAGERLEPGAEMTEPVSVRDLVEDLEDLGANGDTEVREELAETKALLARAGQKGIIESGVRRLDARDAAEAFIGSVIVASSLLVEDGIFDIATHLFESTTWGVPLMLVANTLFVVVMTYALVEWTGRDREEANPLFGFLPERVLMILLISFVVSGVLMTVWGRVSWQAPTEAIARINVLWTVASLGAALGDIVSSDDATVPADGDRTADTVSAATRNDTGANETEPSHTEAELVAALRDQFDELEDALEDEQKRRELREIRARANAGAVDDMFGESISKYTGRDIAEGFVGSIFFSIPFLVEDGVFDVAAYFLTLTVGQFPVFFLVNTLFVMGMILALVYWTGPQDVTVTRPIFGFIPRRLVGISVISFLTAAGLMTMWGRVADWQDPLVAVARISVVWTVASFGASLGDILPGESSGGDINDEITDLSDRVEDLIE